jgi:prepilin-type processing-associated H-X9-DG protein
MCGFNDAISDYVQFTAQTVRLSVFLCPSAQEPNWVFVAPGAEIAADRAPGNSYFASLGPSLEFDASYTGGPPNGLFAHLAANNNNGGSNGWTPNPAPNLAGKKPNTIASILDGTSNTIAFGEWKIGTGNLNAVTIPNDLIFVAYPVGIMTVRNTPMMQANTPGAYAVMLTWFQQCTAMAGVASARQSKTPTVGELWGSNIIGYSLGNTILPPNSPYSYCNMAMQNTIANPSEIGLASYHPGGANVAFADGSVRFLKNSINVQTLWALGTIAGGEVVSADQY